MKEIDLLHAKTSLNALIESLDISVQEIKDKHPQRKDLIDSMDKHLLWITETRTTFYNLESELTYWMKTAHQLHLENLQLSKQNKELKNFIL